MDKDFKEFEDINDEDNLRMDNKIKRLELELKGAKFIEHNADGMEIPPEIESEVLDQLLKFESMKHDAKEMLMFDVLGRPKFKNSEDLTDEEVSKQLDRLYKIMTKKGVMLNCVADVPDRELYEFIVGDFFQIKTMEVPFSNLIRHFIYEEFRPNDKINVEHLIFLFFASCFSDQEKMPLNLLCFEDVLDYLDNFRNLYAGFNVNNVEIVKIDLKKTKGFAMTNIDITAHLENSLKTHSYNGQIKIEVKKNKKGNWRIAQIEFPKLA